MKKQGGEQLPDLITQLQYNDPLTIISRKGTSDDPYIDRADSLPIINGQITLLEIPSATDRVNIAGFTEIDQEVFESRPVLAPHEFLVHYAIGSVQFHSNFEGTNQLCRYKGRGIIMYPSSRIYAMISRNPDIVLTLQDIIEEAQRKLDETQLAIGRIEEVIRLSKEATNIARIAADNANQAADNAQNAADDAKDAYQTTRLVFLTTVADMRELRDTYPNPYVGWTVQTYKDGKRYRFDGSNWIEIDIFGQNLQNVNEFRDGLMSVAEHIKLKSFPVEVKERVIVFGLVNAVQGVQEQYIPFPFKGEITEISALCITTGETRTQMSLERSRNMIDWINITSRKLYIEPQQHSDDKGVVISDSQVYAGDKFRLNMNTQGLGIANIAVSIKIKI